MNQQRRRTERRHARPTTIVASRDDPAVHNALGIALGVQGRLDEAVVCFRRAIALKPDFLDGHYNLGNALAARGRLDEAASCFRTVIDLRPDFLQAHYNLAIALVDLGRLDQAVASFRKAVELKPDFVDAHSNLGAALKNLGLLDQAVASFRKALDLRPDFVEAHYNLGVAFAEQGKPQEAASCFRSAIGLRPEIPEAHNGLGNALAALGRPDEAAGCFRAALAAKPRYPEACYNLGNALAEQGLLGDAVTHFRRAVEIDPAYPAAYYNLGNALVGLERFDQAVASFRTAIALKPDYREACNNLGNVLAEQGRVDEAIASFRTAIDIEPNDPETHSNLGKTLWQKGLLDEALACCRRAIGLQPGYPEAHVNLGVTLGDLGRLDEAIDCYRTAIGLRPDMPDAHHNLGMALLKRGEMEAGWEEYEWRWETRQMAKARRAFAQPQWRGEAAAGQTLLIHGEQGFGDTLQFCRYVPMAAARGLRVVLEVPPALVRILRSLPGIDRVVATGEALPAFDLHCPMLSLPLAHGTTLGSVPGAVPYLRADAAQVAAFETRLGGIDRQGHRIGLVWAGNPRFHSPASTALDRLRSVAPDRLAPLFGIPGSHFVSLQKDGSGAPANCPVTDVMNLVADFADTAALIANLDLVISVDTAVAHLAAALGKPVWLMARFDACWRWLAGRRTSPWYPTLRLYRQPEAGDWESVVSEIALDLAALTREARGRGPAFVSPDGPRHDVPPATSWGAAHVVATPLHPPG